MISNGEELFNLLDELFGKEGYQRKKETYYRNTEECICFFTIEKSPFGGYYDHVMGVFLKEICEEDIPFPKYYKNDLKYSLSKFVGSEILDKALDLEKREFKSNEREIVITNLITQYAIPFLNDISSREGIKNAIQKYDHLTSYMKVRLKKALSIPIDS